MSPKKKRKTVISFLIPIKHLFFVQHSHNEKGTFVDQRSLSLLCPPVTAVDVGADVVQLHLVIGAAGLGLERIDNVWF